MQFDLVHRRYDACIACDALQVIDCEVKETSIDLTRPCFLNSMKARHVST
jgi:hypothetical protein